MTKRTTKRTTPNAEANSLGDLSQAQRFEEAARALGADESEAAFREKVAAIARHNPAPEKAPEPKGKKGGQGRLSASCLGSA